MELHPHSNKLDSKPINPPECIFLCLLPPINGVLFIALTLTMMYQDQAAEIKNETPIHLFQGRGRDFCMCLIFSNCFFFF